MSNPVTKGNGNAITFLRDHVFFAGDECLIWHFSTNGTGYGRLGYLGKGYYAHRLMCEMAHGPAPTPQHEASHSCGNGGAGCVNPRHLDWKTRSANQLDRRRHGTAATNRHGPTGKLTSSDKMAILALRGKLPQRAIAAKFGVHFETISRILRTDPHRQLKKHPWWPEEDARLIALRKQDLTINQIGAEMGRTPSSVNGRLHQLRHLKFTSIKSEDRI